MQTHLSREPRLNSALIIAIVVGMVALSAFALYQRQAIVSNLNLAIGVRSETIEMFESLMNRLGVALWQF